MTKQYRVVDVQRVSCALAELVSLRTSQAVRSKPAPLSHRDLRDPRPSRAGTDAYSSAPIWRRLIDSCSARTESRCLAAAAILRAARYLFPQLERTGLRQQEIKRARRLRSSDFESNSLTILQTAPHDHRRYANKFLFLVHENGSDALRLGSAGPGSPGRVSSIFRKKECPAWRRHGNAGAAPDLPRHMKAAAKPLGARAM